LIALGQIDIAPGRWKEADQAFTKAEALTTKREDRATVLSAGRVG